MPCPRAALFDIDETLTPSFQPIAQETYGLLLSLLERIPVALLTGRGLDRLNEDFLAAMTASPHVVRFFLFPNSGAQCYAPSPDGWSMVYDEEMSEEERARIRALLEEAIERFDFLKNAPQSGERILDRKAQIAFTGVGVDASFEVKSAWDPDKKKREELAAWLRPQLPGFDILIGGASTIDITKNGMNKSHGVRWLSQRLNIPPQGMLYVGDALFEGGNDSVVIPTGIKTKQVASVAETAAILKDLLEACKAL